MSARAERPEWSRILRGLREARGISQDGWASRLGVGRTTLQRWEAGTSAPGAEAESALLRICAELDLYRAFDHGPLQGVRITPERLRDLIAEARLQARRPAAVLAAELTLAAATPPFGRRGNLPVPISSFVGRGREVAQLLNDLVTARLLVLTGAGGIGKTRLAIAVAERIPNVADGVWFVELETLTRAAQVATAVAATLGVQEQSRAPLLDLLVDYLRERELLLLLDNCEHLVAACHDLVRRLLQACPRLRLIATSRQSLGVRGEIVWRVPPLSLPAEPGASREAAQPAEAAQLFVERARAVLPAFVPGDEGARAIDQICRALDGLPLAIELAAARVRVLTVEQIAANLDDRFRLLRQSALGGVERQRTLRATLDWSHDLLGNEERVLLRRLAVFVGGCELAAVEAVCAGADLPTAAVLDTIDGLQDKSLLAVEPQEGAARYRLLETVRRYALAKLDEAGELEALRSRQLAWCCDLAAEAEVEVQGANQQRWLSRLALEHDNLRAALEWSLAAPAEHESGLRLATALRPFWFAREYVSEGRRWLARLLAGGVDNASLPGARALDAAAALAHSQGDYEAAGPLLQTSLGIWRSQGDLRGMAGALNLLGIIEKDRGDRDRAAATLAEALALRRRIGEPRPIATMLNNLAAVAMDAGDYPLAVRLGEESLAIKRRLGDRVGVVVSVGNLAETARLQGDYPRAAALAREALAIARELAVPPRIAQVLHTLGMTLVRFGHLQAGEDAFREALGIFRQSEMRVGVALCYEGLGELAAARGDWERAVRLLLAAGRLRVALGAPATEADRAEAERLLAMGRRELGEANYAAAAADGGPTDAEPA